MIHECDFRPIAYVIGLFGTALSFVASVVPHYGAGHRLLFGVLLAGLLPYVTYLAFSDILRGWPLLPVGLLILTIDLVVKIPERFLHYDGYADGTVYYVPLVTTLVVLPLALGGGALLERRRRRAPEPDAR